jgi:hypothetical protein
MHVLILGHLIKFKFCFIIIHLLLLSTKNISCFSILLKSVLLQSSVFLTDLSPTENHLSPSGSKIQHCPAQEYVGNATPISRKIRAN